MGNLLKTGRSLSGLAQKLVNFLKKTRVSLNLEEGENLSTKSEELMKSKKTVMSLWRVALPQSRGKGGHMLFDY